MDPLFHDRVANVWIGINFLVCPMCVIWLYWHRRTHWPKSWTLLLLGVSVALCGVSRIVHGFFDSLWWAIVADYATAITGTVLACLAPWAVWVFSKIPSPAEIEHAIRGNLQKRAALAEALTARQEAEVHLIYAQRAENRFKAMEALLNHYPLDPALKERIIKVVKEVNE
jgi:hypothetical protein